MSSKVNIQFSLSPDTVKNNPLPFSLWLPFHPPLLRQRQFEHNKAGVQCSWKCACLRVRAQRAEETQHVQLPRHLAGILHLLLPVIKHTAKFFYEDPLRTISFCFPEVGKRQSSSTSSFRCPSESYLHLKKVEIQESQSNTLSDYI